MFFEEHPPLHFLAKYEEQKVGHTDAFKSMRADLIDFCLTVDSLTPKPEKLIHNLK